MTVANADNAAHVLIVDDDTRLRELLRKYLSENGYRVTTATGAVAARDRMRGLLFDIVVLDVMMPGESGIEFARSVRGGGDPVPILMLTARGEPEDRITGLEAGVDDYLPKPFEPKELLLRINSILRRAHSGARRSRRILFGDFDFEVESGRLARNGEAVHLTSGEAAMLKTLAQAPGMTVSRGTLGENGEQGPGRAVDVQITRLRRKIEDDPRKPRHLQTVRGEGYVLWAEPG